MTEVVMLLSNAFRPDPRVAKEANSLARAGYSVTILCWDRQGELAENETLASGVCVKRIQDIRTVYGAGARQIIYTPKFWSAAVERAMALRPGVVHCHDLDTLYAGVRLKKRLGCRLVFDAHEDYPSQMSLYLPGPFVAMLNFLERRLVRQVDASVVASTLYMDKLARMGISRVLYLPNVQDLAPFDLIDQAEVEQARHTLGLENSLVVSYIGGFSRNRLLLPLIEAARSLPDVTLLMAGDGHQRGAIEQAIQGITNVRYLGWIPAEQVPLYTCLSDVIYYCLKPDYPGSHFNAPNTLSNSMAAGRPVIANNLGDLGRIVKATGCGILLDDVSAATITRAMRGLMDASLRERLGQAGRRAAQAEYNWPVVEKRLLALYAGLLQS
jgi:glycosyltransferase involved in cell wall biosynthesis